MFGIALLLVNQQTVRNADRTVLLLVEITC